MRWLIVAFVLVGFAIAAVVSARHNQNNPKPALDQKKPDVQSPRELIGTVQRLDLEKRELVVSVLTTKFDDQPVLTFRIHEDTRIEYWGGKKLKRGPAVIKNGEHVYLEFAEDGKLKSIGRLLIENEDD